MPSKKKEILKEKPSEENSEEVENPPYEIPEHWKWVKTNKIAKIQSGFAFKSKDFSTIGYQVIRMGNVYKGNFDLERTPVFIPKNKVTKDILEKYSIKSGNIIIALTGTRHKRDYGYSVLIEDFDRPLLLNQRLISITPNIEPVFLANYIRTKTYRDIFFSKETGGVNQGNVSSKDVENIPIPLPPLDDQKRIVARLDSMLGKLKEAKKLLEEARETFKDRRSAILAKAFRGELTAKWREENPDVESAEVLLEKISKERFENSKSENETKKLEDIYNYKEVKKFKKLPTTWKVSTLSKICYSFEYGTSAKSLKQGKYVVIRMGNLQQGKIIWDDLAYTNDASEIQKYKLEYNDILFNRTNSAALVGKTSIYKGELPAVFAGYLVRINYHKNINPDYINFALNSDFAKQWCNEVKSDAVNQSNINATKLSFFELPLPPLEEQKEIVRQIESLFAKEDEAKELLDMEEQIELFEKAILAKAFRGELG